MNPSSIRQHQAGRGFVLPSAVFLLVILAALPFIVYLFASSPDYQRSLRAILGIELGSGIFVPGFLLLAVAFSAGFAVFALSRLKVTRPRLTLAAGLIGLLATAAIQPSFCWSAIGSSPSSDHAPAWAVSRAT